MDDSNLHRSGIGQSNGDPITRKLSQSHVTARNMEQYEEFVRRNSTSKNGWLDVRIGELGVWSRKWVVYDDCILYLSDEVTDRRDQVLLINMDNVISIRVDTSIGQRLMVLTTSDCKLYMIAESIDEMNKWTFCFHESFVLLLSKLRRKALESKPPTSEVSSLQTPNKSKLSSSLTPTSFLTQRHEGTRINNTAPSTIIATSNNKSGDDPRKWLSELGHGHGRHSIMLHKRNSFKEDPSQLEAESNLNAQSSSDMDSALSKSFSQSFSSSKSVQLFGGSNISTVDLTQLYVRETGQVLKGQPDLNSNKSLSSQNSYNQLQPYSKPKFSSSYFSTTSAIPIIQGSNVGYDIGDMPSSDIYDQKLAASYNIRNDSKCVLEDEAVDLRMRLMSEEFQRDEDDEESFSPEGIHEPSDLNDPLSSNFDSVMMFDLDDAVTPSVALNDVKSGGISSKAGSSTARSKSDSTPSFVAVALDVLATDPLDVGPTSNSAHFYKSRPSSSKNLNQDNFTELHWQSGYCTILGPRSKNEDRLVALPDLTEETGVIKSNLPFSSSNLNTSSSQAYFAVYDGHCGDGASTYMQRHFHIEVCKHPTFWTDLRRAVAETAIRLDKEFLANCKETKINCGTTALGAFIRGSSLLVFNIGDCHAVISSGGKPRNLSEAHKPNRTDERERITRAGGWVTEERELYMARLHLMDIQDPLVNSLARNIDFVSIYRVCGDLAVTRSIGDPDYKSVIPGQPVTHWFPWPDGHDKIFNADLVIPDPEMTLMTLTSEDEFMILASDGLWDVINSIDAVKIVHEKFLKGKSSSQVAEELCELALRLGSSDNVTIVIIQFVYT